MDMTSVFAEIVKSTPQEDGSLLVYGKATGSDLDLDQQRCDPEWLKTAMPEWFRGPYGGNVREQHDSHRAVGKATEHEVKDDGHWITAKVIDPIAKAKVQAGVLSGFSIGISQPRVEKSPDAANGIISGGKIIEVSLVDRPCLPTAMFTMCKSAKPGMSVKSSDFDAERLLVRCEELIEKADDAVTKSDEMTVTLADHLDPEQVARLEALSEKATAPDAPCCDKCVTVGDACCDMCPPAAKAAEAEAEKAVEFDVDAAKALIAEAIAKADSGLGQDESGDIDGATQAIGIIARLIQSEAKDLEDTPAQGCDIDLLMQAVHALRIFTCREAKEQAGIDPGPAPILLTADADLEKADGEPYGDVSYADPGYQKDKKKRYPVDTKEHAKAALAYISKPSNASGYSPADLAKVKAKIEAACKKFGIEVSSDKAAAEVAKTIETEEAPVADIIDPVEDVEKTAEPVLEKAESVLDEAQVASLINKSIGSILLDLFSALAQVDGDAESIDKAEPVKAAHPLAGELEKAITVLVEKLNRPLNKSMQAVEAKTESTVEVVSDLATRVEKVEAMAVPGGPALRRTEIDRVESRKSDLVVAMNHYKSLANNSNDEDLRKGYDAKARQLAAEIKSL